MQTTAFALAGALIALLAGTYTAAAASIIGLVDGKTPVWVDPATRKVTGSVDIKGSTSIVGIDVRPSDGVLYAVSADGGIYTVDAKTGAATMKSKLSETLKSGLTVTVDVNPVADRMRIITSDGANLRVNIDEAGHLLSQAPPNDGVLNTIGMFGVKIEGPAAFNIVNKGEDNAAWLVTGGTLYSVDLKAGKATMAGKLEGLTGKVTDMAWFD